MPYIGLKLSLEAFESLQKCSKERNISYLHSEPQKSHTKVLKLKFKKGPRIPGLNPRAILAAQKILLRWVFRGLRVKIDQNFY